MTLGKSVGRGFPPERGTELSRIELYVVTEVFYLNKALAQFNTGKYPIHVSKWKSHFPFLAMGKFAYV